MKTSVIIVAGGSGTRMNTAIPKQFMDLSGKPVIIHTIGRFAEALPEAEITVVLPEKHFGLWDDLSSGYAEIAGRCNVCAGGDTRFDSVKNALESIPPCDIVLVHDAVRPFASVKFIRRTLDHAVSHSNAVPVITPVDSYRAIDGADSVVFDREKLRIVQTPQIFTYNDITDAYRIARGNRFTDDASVVEASGIRICLCEGERTNIKITTPADMAVARIILEQQDGI